MGKIARPVNRVYHPLVGSARIDVRALFFGMNLVVGVLPVDRVQQKIADRDVPALFVQESTLLNAETAPKITATVINNSNKDLKNVEAVAVVFNAEDNAIAVSRTLIELPRAERKTIVFTWPKPFPEAVSRIDVQARAPF